MGWFVIADGDGSIVNDCCCPDRRQGYPPPNSPGPGADRSGKHKI